MPLITASEISVSFAELDIFKGVSVDVNERARVGIVGPNGQGKTTLIETLIGRLRPNAGAVRRRRGVTIGYVPQITKRMEGATLKDEVMLAFEELSRIEEELAKSAEAIQNAAPRNRKNTERRYADLLEAYESAGGYDYEHRMERVTAGVGLTPDTLAAPLESASGGQRTRASLAKALLAEPDLLILDEPTNYLDFSGLGWLEGFLRRTSRAFVVVSHDRYFLDQVANEIWEVNHGRVTTFKGNYSKYRHLKADRERRQQTEYVRQQRFIRKQEDFIDRYRAGQRSREALGREKRLKRMERIEAVPKDKSISFSAESAGRTGRIVLATHGLEVGYFDRGRPVRLLAVDDTVLERQTRTAVVGPNGAGKTTFIHTILGMTPPVAGRASLGHNVKVGFQQQGALDLPDHRSALDAVMDGNNIDTEDARTYLGRFLFKGDDVFKRVSVLSGGERTRLALARLLLEEPNVLILDEPTTHLDISSREALEQVLSEYDGALLFVSHDRALISRLATQLLIVEDGRMRLFDGAFEKWAKTKEDPAVENAILATKKKGAKGSQSRKTPKHAPRAPVLEYERIITDLEGRLAEIESSLERAAQRQDLDAVAKLGTEYNRIQTDLQDAWERWSD